MQNHPRETLKFAFENDFGSGKANKRLTDVDLQSAEEKGYARGFQAGQQTAEQHLIALMNQLGFLTQELFNKTAQSHQDNEKVALEFALAFGRKIGGAAIERAPIAPIAEVVKQAFDHVLRVPHLAVRVHESLAEETQNILNRIATEKGFEGQVLVVGEPDRPIGDVLLEWADGGISHSRDAIDNAVAVAVQTWLETPHAQR